MRRASLLAAALALAACQVDVEGARCTVPGSAAECPGGQACGGDLKCSAQAASCQAPNCVIGALRCTGGAAGTDEVEACRAVTPACGAWQASDPCAQKSLVCAPRSVTDAACECPANGGAELAVDPALSQPGLRPTGLPTPAGCRYGRLRDALTAAAGHTGAATVQVYGGTGASVAFGAATGETYPLDVAANVTLIAAAGAAETVVKGDAASAASILTVEGAVQGIKVTNVAMTGTGVELVCPGAGTPTLRDVVVNGATKLTKGISLSGSCGAGLQRVDVSAISGAALDVSASGTSAVTVSGGAFHGSITGIHAAGGKLVLQKDGTTFTAATSNTGAGVVIDGIGAVDLTLSDVVIAGNGGTGFVVRGIPASSQVKLIGCQVYANASGSPSAYGSSGRAAGGILFAPTSLPSVFLMQGNRIYANHGAGAMAIDELVFATAGAWQLNPTGNTSCTIANAIGCRGTSSYSVSVANPGTVDAQYTSWPDTGANNDGFVNSANPCSPVPSSSCP